MWKWINHRVGNDATVGFGAAVGEPVTYLLRLHDHGRGPWVGPSAQTLRHYTQWRRRRIVPLRYYHPHPQPLRSDDRGDIHVGQERNDDIRRQLTNDLA